MSDSIAVLPFPVQIQTPPNERAPRPFVDIEPAVEGNVRFVYKDADDVRRVELVFPDCMPEETQRWARKMVMVMGESLPIRTRPAPILGPRLLP